MQGLPHSVLGQIDGAEVSVQHTHDGQDVLIEHSQRTEHLARLLATGDLETVWWEGRYYWRIPHSQRVDVLLVEIADLFISIRYAHPVLVQLELVLSPTQRQLLRRAVSLRLAHTGKDIQQSRFSNGCEVSVSTTTGVPPSIQRDERSRGGGLCQNLLVESLGLRHRLDIQLLGEHVAADRVLSQGGAALAIQGQGLHKPPVSPLLGWLQRQRAGGVPYRVHRLPPLQVVRRETPQGAQGHQTEKLPLKEGPFLKGWRASYVQPLQKVAPIQLNCLRQRRGALIGHGSVLQHHGLFEAPLKDLHVQPIGNVFVERDLLVGDRQVGCHLAPQLGQDLAQAGARIGLRCLPPKETGQRFAGVRAAGNRQVG
jgi:hypothetical protein